MTMVRFHKILETEDRVRYKVAPLPEEVYAVEISKTEEELRWGVPEAEGVAGALWRHLIRLQHNADPEMTKLTQFPDEGKFRM